MFTSGTSRGGIGTFYNLTPELFVRVYNCARQGDWDGARAAQDRVNDLIRLTLRFPCFAAVKRMLAWSGLDCGACLGPRRTLTPAEEERLRQDLDKAGFEFLSGAARL